MLEQEGIIMNHKRLRRLYREDNLSVRRRRGRKRSTGTRRPMPQATRPKQRWSLDFGSDVFGASHRFRILAVIDDHSRECLALVAEATGLSNVVRIDDERIGAQPGRRQTAPHRRHPLVHPPLPRHASPQPGDPADRLTQPATTTESAKDSGRYPALCRSFAM